tara:strand:- start:58 stop:390 length:333 start_codon:yes stop_codon:yes gene_type:complete
MYAKIVNGIVDNVIVADEDFMKTFVDTSPGKWVPVKENQTPALGGLYFEDTDTFAPRKPFASWTYNKGKNRYDPPVEYPSESDLKIDKDGNFIEFYEWDEDKVSWIKLSR